MDDVCVGADLRLNLSASPEAIAKDAVMAAGLAYSAALRKWPGQEVLPSVEVKDGILSITLSPMPALSVA